MDKIIYGGDTETVRGKPNSIQFYSEDIACDEIHFVDYKTAAKKFLQWCSSRKRNVQHVVYIHNLAFDLIELLWGYHERFTANGGEFEFSIGKWNVRGLYGTPTFCTLRSGHDRAVVLVDSFSFFRGTLASAAELFCPHLPKLQRPRDIGQRRYTAKDSRFVDYAMRDAQVTYHIGKSIEGLHREFDLKQCVSVADLAARIFRHRFLDYTIPQPDHEIVQNSLDAYHGGKNNITTAAGWYPNTYSIDVSSAYPDAMHRLPSFSNAKLYKRYKAKRGSKSVPDYGIFCVDGTTADCKWPVLFDHGFKPLRGAFESVQVQGFELNEALSSGELKASKIIGHYYDVDKDIQAPALRGFCEDFYGRKQTEKNVIQRYMYKLILNSISGKFIQTRKRTLKAYVDIDSGEVSDAAELVAGGMFHPFIAAAITAHTRARIHRLEHHYAALHTATDGIFTARVPNIRGEFRVVKKATKLGELEVDTPSPLLLVRNKCYIKYQPADYKADDKAIVSEQFKGLYISKYAMHGFQGSVHELERLAVTGARTYQTNRPNKLKESIKRGLTPNDFQIRDHTLRVPPIVIKR